MIFRLRACTAAVVLLVPVAVRAADSIDRAELEALRERVRELETQLKAIVQRLDGIDPAAPAAEPLARAPVGISGPERGFAIATPDGESTVRIRGLVQLDGRAFFRDEDGATDTFTLRRARLMADALLARRYGFQFITEFGGNDFSIRDASLTVHFSDAVTLKAGKFKPPVGLELLQQGSVRPMVERSLVTNFVPVRDTGVQLGGSLLGGGVDYAVGVFNGVGDGGISTNADADEPKDVALRLMWHPFRHAIVAPQGFSIGIAGTRGRQHTPAGRLPVYRTDGQQVFFAYESPVVGEGEVTRLSPQFDYRAGRLGVMGEWVASSARLRAGPDTAARLEHRSWQLTSSYVLTGEDSSFHGLVPRADFAPGAGTWGAFEVVGRYAAVKIDDAAFPVFAAPESNASDVSAIGLGLNWHLSKAVRFMFNYTRSTFEVPGGLLATPMLRNGEQVFVSRLQLAF